MKTIDTLKAEAFKAACERMDENLEDYEVAYCLNAYLSYLAEHKAEIVEVMALAAYHEMCWQGTKLLPKDFSDEEEKIRYHCVAIKALTASKLLEPVV